jgi:hypothetical protein
MVWRAAYDPDAPGLAWTEFLQRVLPDEDVREYLQRIIGVALLGTVVEHILDDKIGRAWGQHVKEGPRRFHLMRGEPEGHWLVVLDTQIPMPVRLSTLFGEWLYLLRAALDGLVYYLVCRA